MSRVPSRRARRPVRARRPARARESEDPRTRGSHDSEHEAHEPQDPARRRDALLCRAPRGDRGGALLSAGDSRPEPKLEVTPQAEARGWSSTAVRRPQRPARAADDPKGPARTTSACSLQRRAARGLRGPDRRRSGDGSVSRVAAEQRALGSSGERTQGQAVTLVAREGHPSQTRRAPGEERTPHRATNLLAQVGLASASPVAKATQRPLPLAQGRVRPRRPRRRRTVLARPSAWPEPGGGAAARAVLGVGTEVPARERRSLTRAKLWVVALS